MKTFFKTMAAACLLAVLFLTTSQLHAQAAGSGGWEGRARAQLSECLAGVSSDWSIDVYVDETPIACLVPPCPQQITVSFWASMKCRAGEPCPDIYRFLGQVVFLDSGDPIIIQCGGSPY